MAMMITGVSIGTFCHPAPEGGADNSADKNRVSWAYIAANDTRGKIIFPVMGSMSFAVLRGGQVEIVAILKRAGQCEAGFHVGVLNLLWK
jgi:hypothetical protein